MQRLIRINEIKARAEKIGLSLPVLCAARGVSNSKVYRWLASEVDPGMAGYNAACKLLEDELGQRERALFKYLKSLPSTAGDGAAAGDGVPSFRRGHIGVRAAS